ncbi:MAG: sigma-E processing peptidase SpoIIGA, partial [Firmicutes bacterium]|nr:sigma-E processing peptidase SpoIIGA [Bacillota bacterium]
MYLDLLFFLNLLVHYFLLLFTAKLFHRETAFGRLLAGAAIGALAILVLPFPHSPVLAAALILAAPLLMVLTAFWPLRPLEIFYFWGAFFVASFVVAGALGALLNFNGPRQIFSSPMGIFIIFGVSILLYLLLGLLRPFREDKKWQKILRVDLQVVWQGKEKSFPAFLDTGNRLRDPFSSLPVILVDYRSLEGMLPSQVFHCLAEEGSESWSALERLSDPALARCFTLIPCRGVGRKGEILLGFKPDRVEYFKNGQIRPLGSQVFIALSRRGFGPTAEYRALLPPEL